jgi:dipeptidyl aminopeptidase/acylaminoacyl peptidase
MRKGEFMKRLLGLTVLAVCAWAGGAWAQGPFTVQDLLQVRRVGDPQVSPDGKWVAYQATTIDKAANRGRTQIYVVPTAGGAPKQLTNEAASSAGPRWSPDGARIAFNRGGQLWLMNADGTGAKQITDVALGAGDPLWSPNGKLLAFTTEVYPDCADEACNKARAERDEASKVKAHTADRLLYRHWTAWKDGKRSHVFVLNLETSELKDLTPGDYDTPPFSLGDPLDYAFSPDSKELAFARNTERDEASSTNTDIFLTPVSGGEAQRLTGGNLGYDRSPQYSSGGRYLAYRSQATATFEADRWRLMLYDRQTKQTRELTAKFDLQVDDFVFAPDGQLIYFSVGERGQAPVYSVGVEDGAIKKVIADGFNGEVKVSAGGKLVFSRNTGTMPAEIFRAEANGSGVTQLTTTNDEFLKPFNLKPFEEVNWTGAGGKQIHGYLIKPSNFDAAKKYPLLVVIHGGPQSAFNNNWGYRWNPQVFANAGYVVFMPNPRGSTGYGQKFVNEISQDWGGKVMTDITNGVADALKNHAYLDKNNIGAAGASYGGYAVNWLLGHNNDKRFKFKAFLSHAGVYNLTSMYGVTEELWFVEWEFKGNPWDNPALYQKWSPHLFVKNFNTPTLVTHGELDYRVPIGEGLQLFTALQKRGVESKLIVFPDEGHWILKPQNSEFWYTSVLAWFGKHLK